jgi:hypothetical protein
MSKDGSLLGVPHILSHVNEPKKISNRLPPLDFFF